MEKILYGKSVEAQLKQGIKPVKYAIAELSEIDAKNPHFLTTEDILATFDPFSAIGIGKKSGVPIVQPNGDVVEDNNNIIILKHLSINFPDKYKEYLGYVAENIEAFGFKPYTGTYLLMKERIPLPGSSYSNPLSVKFDHPVLVRVLDEAIEDTRSGITETPKPAIPEQVQKIPNFTEADVINQGFRDMKEKLGERKVHKYFDQVDELINPNTNEIIEYRPNAVITRVGDKYIFNALGDTDFKKWRIAFKSDVTDQFAKPINEPVMDEQVMADMEAVDTPETIADPKEFFFGDNWYVKHPEKILGVAYQTSGRFSEVTKYKGALDVLQKIEVPDNFIGNMKQSNDPLASVIPENNFSIEANKPGMSDFISQTIEQSNADIQSVKKDRQHKKEKLVTDEDVVYSTDSVEVKSFEEVYRNYNENITLDELEAFIAYKTKIGKPLSGQWINLIHPGSYAGDELRKPISYVVGNEKLRDWVQSGIVYYFEGELVPAFLYLSGNVYDKKAALTRDEETIRKEYGDDIFEHQKEALDEVFRVKYQKRLTLQGTSDTGLKLLPISKFAQNFYVTRLDEMAEDAKFKVKKVSAKSDKDFGSPNWAKDMEITREWDRDEFESFNLPDAFSYWLLKSSPELKEAISHYDIVKVYIKQSPPRISQTDPELEAKRAQVEKLKASAQKEGERLFQIFLEGQLTPNDKVKLETLWNSQYNNYVPVDFNKVPVAFTMVRNIKGKEEKLQPEKRDAVAFMLNNGVGAVSYDIGVGKTPSAIFSISAFLDGGYCKRPFIVVPNQVYKQFISEIRKFTPHIPINEAYNLSDDYIENFKNAKGEIEMVPEGSITIMTYEGFEKIGFNDATTDIIFAELYAILNQGGEEDAKKSQRQKEGFMQKLERLVGRGLRGTMINIEDLGFDMGIYDEAHKMKKVFTRVVGEEKKTKDGEGTTREKSPYTIQSGTPSSIALKGFMINQYIQRKTGSQNVMLLTATPFTNSPLEIFSMLTMLAYDQLRKTDLNNIKSFFDTYISTASELVINAKLKPVFKQVITGFNNLISMQSLVRRFILYKTGEEIESVRTSRPKKWVFPLTKKIDGETIIELTGSDRVDTFIQMTASQSMMMNDIISYAEGHSELGQLLFSDLLEDEEEELVEEDELDILSELEEMEDEGRIKTIMNIVFKSAYLDAVLKEKKVSKINKEDDDYPVYAREAIDELIADEGAKLDKDKKDAYHKWHISAVAKINKSRVSDVEVDEGSLSKEEKMAVRTLKALNYARNLALSPYLFKYSGMKNPDYKSYIETSPKLKFIIDCVQSVKMYHESKGQQLSGQVIYMDRGVKYFPLIRQYLIREVGYKPHEVAIIQSGMPAKGKRSKEYVKNLFNGEIYNEDTKQFEEINDADRIKVVIGSSTIKEGINLQRFSTVLYNGFLDWNPTDIQQLEGRIHRQGNTYGNVRIVNPLVIDSADIFIFQKLQEKTTRLNSIWSMDGEKNVLDTSDFDPSELKYALIRDPKVIAELRVIEDESKYKSEKLAQQRLLEKTSKLKEDVEVVNDYFKEMLDSLKGYRDFKTSSSKFDDATRLIDTIIKLEKTQTDMEGKEMVYKHTRDYERDPKVLATYSKMDRYSKPWRFSDFSLAVRDIKRSMKDFINPYNIDFDLHRMEGVEDFERKTAERLKELDTIIAEISSKEKKEKLIEEIIQERKDKHIEPKSLHQVVGEFAAFNYLLDERKIVVTKKLYTTAPPMDGDKYSIEPEALALLDESISSMPQTKFVNFDKEKNAYLPARQRLHDSIITGEFMHVKCLTKDKPLAVFTGGSPGSGKTTFLQTNAPYLLTKDVFNLDADEIRSKFPEYEGWNANITHDETQDITNAILDQLGTQKCKYDVVFDGTMNKAHKYFKLIDKVKKLGYETFIIFMEVPYGVSKKRVMERYQRTGRYVPLFVIDEFFERMPNGLSRGQDSLNQLKGMVDGYIVVNGETGEVIEKSGIALPDSRHYGESVAETDKKTISSVRTKKPKFEEVVEPVPAPENTREKIEKQINGLNLAAKYASGTDKETINKQIKGLTLSLKYM